MTFDTPIETCGPVRRPRNMLVEQAYGDHASIHDAETAAGLGLAGAAVEGPTHFSQYDPLFVNAWGTRWFETGVISAHFETICLEGESTRAYAAIDGDAATIRTEKTDGAVVLSGSAGVGDGPTALDARLAKARPPADPLIFAGWTPGRTGIPGERVRMGFDTHMGDLYPFTLADKLATITETSAWYTSADNPWGCPIVPIEMISVLALASVGESGLVKAEPSVGLFLDLEIRLLGSPVLVDRAYVLDREVVALSESRRVESAWLRTTVREEGSGRPVARVLLHQGAFKESYPGYRSYTDRPV